MISTSNWGQLQYPGFKQVFDESFKRPESFIEKLFKVENSDRAYELVLKTSGFGLAPIKDQGKQAQLVDPQMGWSTQFTHVLRSMGYAITLEMQQDDLYGQTMKLPAQLADSMNETPKYTAASVIDRAHNSAYALGDGQPIFSTAHPLLGGGTSRNRLSTLAALSQVSYEQALTDFRRQVDNSGKLAPFTPKYLVIAPTLQWTARRLLGSDMSPEAVSGTNTTTEYKSAWAVNPVKGSTELCIVDYLNSQTSWHLQAENHGLEFYWRFRPDYVNENEVGSGNAKFYSRMRYSVGARDWLGVFAGNS